MVDEIEEQIQQESYNNDFNIIEDAVLKPYAVGTFLDKHDFVNKRTMLTIKNYARAMSFGKPSDKLMVIKDNELGILSLNKSEINQLIELLGPNVKDWKNQVIYVTAKPVTFQIKNEIVDSTMLTFQR